MGCKNEGGLSSQFSSTEAAIASVLRSDWGLLFSGRTYLEATRLLCTHTDIASDSLLANKSVAEALSVRRLTCRITVPKNSSSLGGANTIMAMTTSLSYKPSSLMEPCSKHRILPDSSSIWAQETLQQGAKYHSHITLDAKSVRISVLIPSWRSASLKRYRIIQLLC